MTRVVFNQRGQLDLPAVDEWVGTLRDMAGAEILQIAGVIALEGSDRRYIYRDAGSTFTGEWGDEWADDEERGSNLVVVGRHLDEVALRAQFGACLSTSDTEATLLASLRFQVGDQVQCYLPGPRRWANGKVVARRVRRKGLAGVVPYQVRLDEGNMIILPSDDDLTVRAPPKLGEAVQSFLRSSGLSKQRGEDGVSTQSGRCCARETRALPGACCDTKWMR